MDFLKLGGLYLVKVTHPRKICVKLDEPISQSKNDKT